MTDLTLDEELFLLSRDPDSGRDRAPSGIDPVLAGAVLIGLTQAGAITIEDGRVVATDAAALPRPHLTAAWKAIADEPKPRRPRGWVQRLPSRLGLQEQVGLSLVERGILADARSSFLGITIKRFPERDPRPGAEVRARVVGALTGADPEPAQRTRILAGLLGAAGLVRRLVERPDRRAAGRRAQAYLREGPVGEAVSDAVAAAQQATIVAVSAAVLAASAGGGDGGGDGGGAA